MFNVTSHIEGMDINEDILQARKDLPGAVVCINGEWPSYVPPKKPLQHPPLPRISSPSSTSPSTSSKKKSRRSGGGGSGILLSLLGRKMEESDTADDNNKSNDSVATPEQMAESSSSNQGIETTSIAKKPNHGIFGIRK
jgi:hypothetical protein